MARPTVDLAHPFVYYYSEPGRYYRDPYYYAPRAGAYYGTPRYGYFETPYGTEGVRVGTPRFAWND